LDLRAAAKPLNDQREMNLADLFTEEDYRFQMALRRGSPAEFFQPSANHLSLIAERKRWLASEPLTYSALVPEGKVLLDECIGLAAEWQSVSAEEHGQLTQVQALRERCTRVGEIWEPDFLLLRPDQTRRFQLVGGCVCFPSSWSLAGKIGCGLESIHGPAPGLNAALGRSIDSLLAKLEPGTSWFRHNWGLSRSRELNQHPSRALPRLDTEVKSEEVWLRVEHQALVALPQTGGILFGIRIAMHSLSEVKQNAVVTERLCRALRTMPDNVAAYKGLATARRRVIELLCE
jgi:dimethylamine monooxygenase subunit A